MRLSKIKVSNFRCFGPEETVVNFDAFTAMIGANSTGKTALLHAILKVFGTGDARELRRSDFHVPIGAGLEGPDSIRLSIEAVLVFPELRDCSDPLSSSSVPQFFNQMVVSDVGAEPYVRVRLTAEWMRTASLEGDIESHLDFVLAPESEPFTDNTLTTRVLAHQRTQVQVEYVPAVRDPSVHLRARSSAILWRLLRAVPWSEKFEDELINASTNIDGMFTEYQDVKVIQTVLQSSWSSLHAGGKYTHADIVFAPSEFEDILRRVQVTFKPTPDGGAYSVDQIGDGLRSLFYLSMVSMLPRIEQERTEGDAAADVPRDLISPALTIFAIEEPENHLAPHLLGKVVQHCCQIAATKGCQTIITSHTPAVLRRVQPEDIRYFRLTSDNRCTEVREIILPPDVDDAGKYVREAVRAYPEIYFSTAVVLGEGRSEEIVLSRAIEAFGHNLDISQISVVPLGGRHVNHFWRLLNDLHIPHVTLLDLDRERPGGGWGRIRYALKQLLEIQVSGQQLLGPVDGSVSGILTEKDLDSMSGWSVGRVGCMQAWMERLEEHNVFFSSPLDLDFSMLCALSREYKKAYPRGRGPRISTEPEKRADRLARAARMVLADTGRRGQTYSEDEKLLFPWYTYLFLGRSKPSVHLAALRLVDDETLVSRLPESLKNLVDKVIELARVGT